MQKSPLFSFLSSPFPICAKAFTLFSQLPRTGFDREIAVSPIETARKRDYNTCKKQERTVFSVMLYPLLSPYLGQPQLFAICALFCFLLTTVLLHVDLPFLPKDQGRVNAVNGELSKGKVRGVGLVMMICFVACAALFIPFSLEFMFYALLLLAEMFSGYLDDASKLPWSDYKKGLIDFVISVLVGVVFVLNDSTTIYFGTFALTLHPVLYGALATVHFIFRPEEAVWLSLAIEASMGMVVFGVPAADGDETGEEMTK